MNIARVEIATQSANLGMRSSKPPMDIQQPKAEMKIRQNNTGKLNISSETAKVTIDQSKAFADAGLLPPLEKASQFVDKAKRTASEYVAKQAQEGEQLKSIDKNGGGGKAIASISKQNSKIFNGQTELGFTPKNAFKVEFHTKPGDVSFQVDRATAEIEINRNNPSFEIPRWEVQHYVKQQPDINFHRVGGRMNQKL